VNCQSLLESFPGVATGSGKPYIPREIKWCSGPGGICQSTENVKKSRTEQVYQIVDEVDRTGLSETGTRL
jgi:hypothetical protein